mgnify:CR=1 FL=1
MSVIRRKIDNFSITVLKFLGSNTFLYVIIGLFVVQALWFAFSLAYPLAYDESYHFGIIKAYTGQLGPIIFDQPESLDYLRDLENETSFIYHYLMSFPLRFIMLFTESNAVQVISLRIINIAFAAGGFFAYAKLFTKIKMPKLYTNIGLFFFSMIPVLAYLSATINYDNLLMPVTAGYFIACATYLRGKPWQWQNIASVVALGTFASLVKFTFLPLFAVSLGFFAVRAWQYRIGFFRNLGFSIKTTTWRRNTVISLVLVSTIGLFSSIYFKNVVVYGTPLPSCQITLSAERCKANPIIVRGEMIRQNKEDRKPDLLSGYVMTWIETMFSGQSQVIVRAPAESNPKPSSLPIITNTLFFGGIISIAALLYAGRRIQWSVERKFLLVMTITLFAAVFMKTASGYFTHYLPLAIQPRYLFTVLPILIVLSVCAFGIILRGQRTLAVACLLVITLLLTQGGGMTSYLLRSEPDWYWDSQAVRDVNSGLKKITQPFVKEYPDKYGF